MNDRARITIRIVAGGYLAYLGFDLLKNVITGKPGNSLVFIICGVLFLVIGLLYLVKSVQQYRAYEEPTCDNIEDMAEDVDLMDVEVDADMIGEGVIETIEAVESENNSESAEEGE